jgi:hypothetical protein
MFPWETLITGAVGLAGIGGTLWQGKRSREAQSSDLKASLDATTENLRLGIRAENGRARLADKRRIYAGYNAAIHGLDVLVSMAPSEASESWVSDHNQAVTTILDATAEVTLIAPRPITILAGRLANAMIEYTLDIRDTGEVQRPSNLDAMRTDILNAMVADLGEPG